MINATSRKLRPFSGRLWTSAWDTVPAIWLRAASMSGASADTLTVVSRPPTRSVIGSSNADPIVTVTGRVASANPGRLATTS